MTGPTGAIGLNFFEADLPLARRLGRHIDPAVWPWAERWLKRWGDLCGGPVAERAEFIDKNPPRLVSYDRWGSEINRVIHHPEAIATKRDLCEAGYTGFGWSDEVRTDPQKRAASQLLATAFSYMLNQSDTGMACACGMTGGVARIVDSFAPAEVREVFLPRLTTTVFDELWDGAMFMTERSGGSDLSGTETVAVPDGGAWRLTGDKWFCSNVDARAILTLARVDGRETGTKGLGLFLVPSMLDDGEPNSLRIRRIKDKLGTRSVPTGEVSYEGAVAYQISEPGVGINRMMEMVNISRLGVALMGAGIARRSTLEASIYAGERSAFGKRLNQYPMVRRTLIDMQVDAEAALALCVESSAVAARIQAGAGTDDDRAYLRIITPLAKIRAARIGLLNAVEAVEMLGGNGYIEDWPTARQLRDAQCHTIWEGTENINSLDVLRSMAKQSAHTALFARIDEISSSASDGENLAAARREAEEALPMVASAPEVHARDFANLLGDLTAAALLSEEAVASGAERDRLVARRYADRHLGSTARLVADPEVDEAFAEIVPPFVG
jgi:acyl-CoA dehydrogenase